MHGAGHLVQALDNVAVPFVFALCVPCRLRHDRLPANAKHRQHSIAIRRIAEDPSFYPVMVFASEIEARIFVALTAERDPQSALDLFD